MCNSKRKGSSLFIILKLTFFLFVLLTLIIGIHFNCFMHFFAITVIHVLQGTSSWKEKQIKEFEERNNFDLLTNSLLVFLVSVCVELYSPFPIGVHVAEGIATVHGRIPNLVRLPFQVEPDVAAQMTDPVLNLPGAVRVAAAVALPTPLLLLRAAVGPEIGVRRLPLFKLGLQVLVSFDVRVLDVPKYLGVP